MTAFDFQPRTRIIYGADTVDTLGAVAGELGARRVLLVTDPGIMAAGHHQRALASLESANIETHTHDYIQGHTPAEDIVACALETGAELIVIGLRHRSKTGKYLMGSVAQDVLLDAPSPVLAVRAADAPSESA